jgi:hypothetical protein
VQINEIIFTIKADETDFKNRIIFVKIHRHTGRDRLVWREFLQFVTLLQIEDYIFDYAHLKKKIKYFIIWNIYHCINTIEGSSTVKLAMTVIVLNMNYIQNVIVFHIRITCFIRVVKDVIMVMHDFNKNNNDVLRIFFFKEFQIIIS